MLVSGTGMAGACGVAIPFCRGSYVLTAHMSVSVQFVSVHLLELVLSKFNDDTSSNDNNNIHLSFRKEQNSRGIQFLML